MTFNYPQVLQPLVARSGTVVPTYTVELAPNPGAATSWLRTASPALRLDPTWRWFILGFALLMAGYPGRPRAGKRPSKREVGRQHIASRSLRHSSQLRRSRIPGARVRARRAAQVKELPP